MPSHDARLYLSLEEIEQLVEQQKTDLQREANQGIRKKDFEQGIGALASMEALDNFLYNCRLAAGQFSPEKQKEREYTLEELKKTGLQLVGKRLRKKGAQ